MSSDRFHLQIVIACGPEAVERATLGLATALAAAVTDQTVVVFLTMRGAAWASPCAPEAGIVPGFDDVGRYIEMLCEAGARIEACTSCVDNFCEAPLDEGGKKQLRSGLVRAGLSTAALRATSVPTLVF